MRAVVDAAEPLGVDVAVDLRRRERRVAEQLLDRRAGRRRPRAGASRTRGGGGAGAAARRRSVEVSSRRPRAERKSASLGAARELGPRLAQVAARPSGRPPRRAARRGPSRPCRARTWTCSCSKSTSPRSSPTASALRRPGRVDELEQRAVAERERLAAAEGRRAARRPRPPSARPAAAGRGAARAATSGRGRGRARSGAAPRTADEPPRDRRRRELPAGPGAAEVGGVVGEHAHVDLLERPSPYQPAKSRRSARRRAGSPSAMPAASRYRSIACSSGHRRRVRARRYDRLPWTSASRPSPSSPSTARTSSRARSSRSARPIGQEELARAIAAAAYRRGALFVDVAYFDPYVKRARIEHADPGHARLRAALVRRSGCSALAERGDARIGFAGVVAPDALDGLDPALARPRPAAVAQGDRAGRQRPRDELDDRSRARTATGRKLVYPGARRGRGLRAALERALARPPARRARPGRGVGRAHRRR